MARLRDKDAGCPWDVAQSFATIAPYTIEEAYEVADAIAREDREALKEELGDLLLQVVYHAQMASEERRFAFARCRRRDHAKDGAAAPARVRRREPRRIHGDGHVGPHQGGGEGGARCHHAPARGSTTCRSRSLP